MKAAEDENVLFLVYVRRGTYHTIAKSENCDFSKMLLGSTAPVAASDRQSHIHLANSCLVLVRGFGDLLALQAQQRFNSS